MTTLSPPVLNLLELAGVGWYKAVLNIHTQCTVLLIGGITEEQSQRLQIAVNYVTPTWAPVNIELLRIKTHGAERVKTS